MTSRETDEMTGTPEALEVLREVWSAQGQSGEDLSEAYGEKKSCKNMVNVGFDGLAGDYTDVRTAWRARLRREGKLDPEAGSLRDLISGEPESS